MTHPNVTMHAVRRFAERVLGLTELPETDAKAMVALRLEHGIDTLVVRKNLAWIVRRGVECGAPVVLFGRARFILEGSTLVTVQNAYGHWDRRARPRFDDDEE